MPTSQTIDVSSAAGVAGRNFLPAVKDHLEAIWKTSAIWTTGATGTASAQTVTAAPAPGALVAGMAFWVTPSVDLTPGATLTINSLGAKAIGEASGRSVTWMSGGRTYLVVYTGAVFRLVGPRSAVGASVGAVAISASTSLTTAHDGMRVEVTTGASDVTVTLWAGAPVYGDAVEIVKVDTGTGKVIVKSGTTALAWLSGTGDRVGCLYGVAGWQVDQWQIAPLRVVHRTTVTSVAMPPLTSAIVGVVKAGGNGGGSGRVGAAGTVRCGGGGGGSGSLYTWTVSRADCGTTYNATVGAGGIGGAGVATSDTDGLPGSGGGASSWSSGNFRATTFLSGNYGLGGTGWAGYGGGTTGALAQVSQMGSVDGAGLGGSAASTGGASNYTANQGSGGGGGAGGGITSGNVSGAGSSARTGHAGVSVPGGAVGADGTTPTIGSYPAARWTLGGGGGGGGSGGNGGAGGTGLDGGGGGGGGAAANGSTSGAGGAGGAGFVELLFIF